MTPSGNRLTFVSKTADFSGIDSFKNGLERGSFSEKM